MDLKYININQICSVRGRFIRLNDSYHYIKYRPKKGFFSKEVKEGIYHWGDYCSNSRFYDQDDIFRKGNKVYNYPYLEFTMTNSKSHSHYFKSNEEMMEFLSKNIINNPNIISVHTPLRSREVLLEKYKGYSDELRVFLKNKIKIGDT